MARLQRLGTQISNKKKSKKEGWEAKMQHKPPVLFTLIVFSLSAGKQMTVNSTQSEITSIFITVS